MLPAWGRHADTNAWFQASHVSCNRVTDTELRKDAEKQNKLPEEAPEEVSSGLVVQGRAGVSVRWCMGEVNFKALAVGLAGAKNVAGAAGFGGAQGAGLCGVLWERDRTGP